MPIIIHGSSKSFNLQEVRVRSTTEQREVTPSDGYDGISNVTVLPLRLQKKTVTPSSSKQVIEASALYDGLGKVTVEAVSSTKVYGAYSVIPQDWNVGDTGATSAKVLAIAPAKLFNLYDNDNSGDSFPANLYGIKPKAVIGTVPNAQSFNTSATAVYFFHKGYGNRQYNFYQGQARYNRQQLLLGSADCPQLVTECSADGTVKIILYMSVSNNLDADSYDVYLIF